MVRPNMEVRELTAKDLSLWKEIRLKALKECPEAYGASYEEQRDFDDEFFLKQIQETNLFGAFDGSQLIGTIGLSIHDSEKTKHKGSIYAVYVHPNYRSNGIGDTLLKHVIGYAKAFLLQLNLSCAVQNQAAYSLYEKHGFELIGTEPLSLKVGDTIYDEHLMVLTL